MEPTGPPRLSPDGKFYWAGGEWKPMPAESPRAVTVKPARWRYWFWTIVILGPLSVGLCGALTHAPQ